MFGYIYKTTNLINGKIYIGQHHGKFDPLYLGSGNLIQLAIRKYKRQNFSVVLVEECFNEEDMAQKEIKHIDEARSLKLDVYNIASGGLGHTGPFTEEHIKKIRTAARTPERRALSSKLHKGKKIPQHIKERHSEFMKGRIASHETRKKMSMSQRARPAPSEETKKRLAETWEKRRAILAERLANGEKVTIHDISLTKRSRRKHDTGIYTIRADAIPDA